MPKIITIDRCEDCKHCRLPPDGEKVPYLKCTLKQEFLPKIVTGTASYTAPIPEWCPLEEAPYELTDSDRAFIIAFGAGFGEKGVEALINMIEEFHNGKEVNTESTNAECSYQLWQAALKFAGELRVEVEGV